MSQYERLREALLEIELLRERERKTLRETQALLDILQVTTTTTAQAAHPRNALRDALQRCADVSNASGAMIVRLVADGFLVEASTNRDIENETVHIGASFFGKPRNILDVRQVPELSSVAFLETLGAVSLLVATDRTEDQLPRSLLCWHDQPRRFSKQNLAFAQRAIQLIAQSSRTAELAAQNALLAAVIDGSSSGFAISDATQADLPLIFVNQAFETLTGYSEREVVGQNCRFLSAEPRDAPERARLREAVENRTHGRFLLRNKRKDGTEFWNGLSLFPVRDNEGKVVQMVATQTDATERVEAERERRKLQDHLQNVLEHTQDAFLMVLEDGRVAFANDGTREMFDGGEGSWRTGTDFSDNWAGYLARLPNSVGRLPEELRHPDLAGLADQVEGVRTSLPDGRQVLFRAQHAGNGAIVVSATDTTAIRTTERLLRQRVAAVEHASDGIAILDDDGRVAYANSALGQLLQYDAEEHVLGRKWDHRYNIPDNPKQLRAEIGLTGTSEILEFKSGGSSKFYHAVTRTKVDKVGEVMVVRDVTAALRNRHRLSELDKQIEDARRREAISNLAAGLAHDFNNVLSAVSGSATLVETDPDATNEIKEHASRISKASSMAARLVNRMLDLSSAGDDASVFDLRSILTEVQELAKTNLSEGTEFSLDAGKDRLNIRASAQDITLALLNLVINAHDALPDGEGRVNVVLARSDPNENRTPLQGNRRSEQAYAQLSVSDTGSGMTEDVLQNVLQPYFTTKGSRGTGAGLAMVSAIVKRLDGVIYIESSPGKGTIFDILLPVFDDTVPDELDPAVAPDLSGRTVLVLDDQGEVASVTASYLEKCGAEVSVLEDPELAIEVILEDPEEWTALITDYDMPGKNGGDVVEAIRDENPNFTIFVVTALARRLSDPRISNSSVRGVFAKPTDLGQLANAIHDLEPTL